MKRPHSSPKRCRIVLTGGPGGGKTILFQGGFPRSREPQAARFAQTAIFHVQRHLEDVQAALFPDRTLLCDRGTVDGAVYWPGQPHDYFNAVGTTLDSELARYDAVIFFETAARGGISIEGCNPIRNESLDEADKLDGKLRALWSRHPRFTLIPHNPSSFKKISFGLAALESIVAQFNGDRRRKPIPPRARANPRAQQ